MWHRLAKSIDIPHRHWITRVILNIPLVTVNLDGTFYTLEDTCTHDGSELAGEPLEEDTIVCPRHGARFCVKTGKVLEGPAYDDLRLFPTKVDEGWVWVEIADIDE